jgi:hypothetical protein
MRKRKQHVDPLPVGSVVHKISGKPFKSGLKRGTVSGVIDHLQLPGIKAYTFEEDESYVRVSYCEEWKLIALHIDALVQRCGWFTMDTELNNGYGCNHPETEIEFECDGDQRRCNPSSCPVASCFDDWGDPDVVRDAAEYGITPDNHSAQEWMEWDPSNHKGGSHEP